MHRVLIGKRMAFLEPAERRLGEHVELVYAPSPLEDGLIPCVSEMSAIVAGRGVKVTAAVIRNAPQLRIVATPTAGYDEIDVDAATNAGVVVVANTGVAPRPVAEFAVGLIVGLGRRIVKADRDLHQEKSWAIRPRYADATLDEGADLSSCTVGIVGVGQIGSLTARICRDGLAMRVLGFDPYLSAERARDIGVEPVASVHDLARESDFVVLHAQLTPETRHLINREILGLMKPSAFLVNCARGEMVDEAALIEALSAKRIAGAALDVFEREPLEPSNPLLSMDNVILTPHIAGVTVQGDVLRATQVADRVLDVLAGRKPEGLINPDAWPKLEVRLKGKD